MSKVLVVAPFPPRLDGRHGGSKALAQLVARLAARHSVALLVLRGPEERGVDDVIRRICAHVEEVEIAPVGRSFGARLIRWTRHRAALLGGMPTWASERTANGFGARLDEFVREWRPEVVQVVYRIMGRFLPVNNRWPVPCLLVDYDPGGPDRSRSLLERQEQRAWKSLGRAVSKRVDSIVVLTERDRGTISELSGATPVVRIPLGYDLPALSLDPTGTELHGIVCIGSFAHAPNVDAARWLAEDIFPSVKARVPEASLQLIGSQLPRQIHALEGGGVTVSGDVPDVRPYLDAAAVVAAPIRLGGGMRVKVLEALAFGKAIVATSLALDGLEVTNGEHVLVADTGPEFVDALVELLTDTPRRTAIATAARRWAGENLDPDLEVRAYEALYASLARAPR